MKFVNSFVPSMQFKLILVYIIHSQKEVKLTHPLPPPSSSHSPHLPSYISPCIIHKISKQLKYTRKEVKLTLPHPPQGVELHLRHANTLVILRKICQIFYNLTPTPQPLRESIHVAHQKYTAYMPHAVENPAITADAKSKLTYIVCLRINNKKLMRSRLKQQAAQLYIRDDRR